MSTSTSTPSNAAASNARFAVKSLFDVEDWVCVVTGGATGIGLMIAQAYANNGARVYLVGRRADALDAAVSAWGSSLAHPKGKLIPLPADVTSKASIQALVDEIGRREPRVDVLVNNAGVSLGTSSVEKGDESAGALRDELWAKETPEDWDATWRTNVAAPFFATAAFLPLLSATAAATEGGRTAAVLVTASMSGITRTSQHHVKYNASKAAALHLTKMLAQELRRPGVNVRVNSISPGIFPSEMTAEGSDGANKSEIPTGDDYGEKKGIPAGRPGAEQDMAQAALFLGCCQYAYGTNVTIDGGYLLEHP